jgi:hypothetical protein
MGRIALNVPIRRHPPEETECGSGDGSERPRGWIRNIHGGDSAARWWDHLNHRRGGCPIGRRRMMVTNDGWTPRTQRSLVFPLIYLLLVESLVESLT